MADANVALASGPVAQIINPANLVDIRPGGRQWEAGTLLAQVDTHFSRAAPASAARAMDINARTAYPLVPYAALAVPYSERVTLGFAVDSPHGLSTEWKDHTWDVNLGSLGSADMVKLAQLTVRRFRTGGRLAAGRRLERGCAPVRAICRCGRRKRHRHATCQRHIGWPATRRALPRTEFHLRPGLYHADQHQGCRQAGQHSRRGHQPGRRRCPRAYPVTGRLQTGVAFRCVRTCGGRVDLDWIGWSYCDELRRSTKPMAR